MGRKTIDVTGQKFGLLTAVRQVTSCNRRSRWECICQCGRIVVIQSHNLRAGQARHQGPCTVRTAMAKAKAKLRLPGYRSNVRLRRRAAGQCVRCTKPAVPDRTRCEHHLATARADQARRAAAQKEKQNNP